MNAVVELKPSPVTLMAGLMRAAADPGTDVAKLKELYAMYEQIATKEAEIKFNAAMTKCQREMTPISTNASNPQTHSKYATYAQLDKALRPIYTKHGFALSFDEGVAPYPEYVRTICIVSHSAGFSRTYTRDMPADGKGAKGGDVMTKTHAAAAAMAYAMRYLLKGVFNVAVATDDRDGNPVDGGLDPKEPLVSEQQVADLKAVLTETGADIPAFLKYIKASSLTAIYAKNYDAVLKTAQAKRRQQHR